MFGAIVAGRLVQTNLQQIDETHFVFPLEQPYEINHLTVFLLGTKGYGASVHFAWPGREYIPLGTLTNARPSSIYRVRPHLPAGIDPSTPSAPAQLGIEIAPLTSLDPQVGNVGKEVSKPVEVGEVAEKVVKNLFNYLHSFGGEVKLTPETPIPLSVFQQWYNNFLRKVDNDKSASFLDRD